VVGQVIPWNFPLLMLAWKVAPALAAGNTVVLKPAEYTPLTALLFAELAAGAGLPPGVLNIVTSDGPGSIEVGKTLCASDVVRHISFTGSTEVGRILMAQSAPTVKKMSLELGGNAPFIVFDDADIDSAVEGAFASKYRNAGQTCVCSNRIYVQEAVYEEFAQKFTAKVKTAKVGNGFEDGINQGPLIEPAALAKVERHVQDALDKGARVLTGGKRHALGGLFFEPTILADVTQSMRVVREETFGPVACIMEFEADDEAVRLANDSPYGLGAAVFGERAHAERVGRALTAGMIGINQGCGGASGTPSSPRSSTMSPSGSATRM